MEKFLLSSNKEYFKCFTDSDINVIYQKASFYLQNDLTSVAGLEEISSAKELQSDSQGDNVKSCLLFQTKFLH